MKSGPLTSSPSGMTQVVFMEDTQLIELIRKDQFIGFDPKGDTMDIVLVPKQLSKGIVHMVRVREGEVLKITKETINESEEMTSGLKPGLPQIIYIDAEELIRFSGHIVPGNSSAHQLCIVQ